MSGYRGQSPIPQPPISSGSELDQFCEILRRMKVKATQTCAVSPSGQVTIVSLIFDRRFNIDFSFGSDEKFRCLDVYPLQD